MSSKPKGDKAGKADNSILEFTGCWRNVAIMLAVAGLWLGANYLAPPVIMPETPAAITVLAATPRAITPTRVATVQPLPTPSPTVRR
ncbi:MAG: hypothetical protein HY782_10110 [Chloroflexi bacterium]|nr:hypothetical protein [Chloroflexota bacterium]